MRKTLRLAILAALATLGLTACQLDTHITLRENSTADMSLTFTQPGGKQAPEYCQRLKRAITTGPGISLREIDDPAAPGCQLTATGLALADIERELPVKIKTDTSAGTYTINMPAIAEFGNIPPAAQGSLTVVFPGPVTSASHAKIDGSTAHWASIDSFVAGATATGRATAPGMNAALKVGIYALIGAIVGVAVWLVIIRPRRRAPVLAPRFTPQKQDTIDTVEIPRIN